MRPLYSPYLAIIAFAFSASAVAIPNRPRRPDLNAFVNRKIVSAQGLVNQVQNDPEVADRYQRHFAMNRQEIVSYLGDLRPGKLSESGVYTVYSVPDDGHVKMHRETLKRGEPVFFDRAGRPTLVMKCGNPLVLGPSRARRGNPVTTIPVENDTDRTASLLDPRDVPLLESDPAELLASLPPVPEAILPGVVATPPILPPVAAVVNTVPVSAIGGGTNAFPFLLGFPLLLPLADAFGGGNGGDNFSPVPEPMPLAALALGAVAIARRRKA